MRGALPDDGRRPQCSHSTTALEIDRTMRRHITRAGAALLILGILILAAPNMLPLLTIPPGDMMPMG